MREPRDLTGLRLIVVQDIDGEWFVPHPRESFPDSVVMLSVAEHEQAMASLQAERTPEAMRGPLRALIDALRRRRCVFWTGNVLVELDDDHVPDGPVTMVLDADDFAALVTGGTNEPASPLYWRDRCQRAEAELAKAREITDEMVQRAQTRHNECASAERPVGHHVSAWMRAALEAALGHETDGPSPSARVSDSDQTSAAHDALAYLADPGNWLGDPLDQTSTLHGHLTPFEMARRALGQEGDDA